MMASWKVASLRSASWSVASRSSASWKFAILGVGLLLGGCIQTTLEPASTAGMKPRDRELLAHPPYAQASIPEQFQRHIVEYHRKEAPGTIVIDTDNRYLYLVQAGGKAIRYGVTVGEEAQGWSGVATIGSMTEWPSWTPTAGEHQRLGPLPEHMPGGPANPMGARAMYLYSGGKDTLYRIHGTNQPEYIGQAISSGCIRLTNENVIDLYNRVKVGATVVVLARGQGDSPFGRLALSGQSQ
jgi:lipoprotein-anchoring transpeptidase ErfK/SrfK